jgi:hypothetical protein
MTSYSITQLMADIAATNNGRLLSISMTAPQHRAAAKAMARGLVVSTVIVFPLIGAVTAYSKA